MELAVLKLNNLKANGFIKSRKSDSKLMDISEEMHQFAEDIGIELLDIICDRKSNDDVDRDEITELMQGFEAGDYSVILVRNLFEITKDQDEIVNFVNKINASNGIVISLDERCIYNFIYDVF